MQTNYFDIQDFLIDPDMRSGIKQLPLQVINTIITHHLPILNDVREKLGKPVYISQHSGYRPVYWEKRKGRDGTSQHTFTGEACMGAVDVTCGEGSTYTLLQLLCKSNYRRVCYYPQDKFIHCDFKGDEFLYFEDYGLGKGWQFVEERK